MVETWDGVRLGLRLLRGRVVVAPEPALIGPASWSAVSSSFPAAGAVAGAVVPQLNMGRGPRHFFFEHVTIAAIAKIKAMVMIGA